VTEHWIDTLSRALARGGSRKDFLKLLGATAVGMLLGGADEAEAAKKRGPNQTKGKPKKSKQQKGKGAGSRRRCDQGCLGERPNCCNGYCTNVQIDVSNCGGCGRPPCGSGQICRNGACIEPGTPDLSGCAPGYEQAPNGDCVQVCNPPCAPGVPCVGGYCCATKLCDGFCCDSASDVCTPGFPACCPPHKVCNGTCCPSGERCIDGSCHRTCDPPCTSAQVCMGEQHFLAPYTCCAPERICDATMCCTREETCLPSGRFGKSCCPASSVCGGICCTGAGETCVNGQCVRTCGTLTCPVTQDCCRDVCCPEGQFCCNGACLESGGTGSGGRTLCR
jgi:hypothetical protein